MCTDSKLGNTVHLLSKTHILVSTNRKKKGTNGKAKGPLSKFKIIVGLRKIQFLCEIS